MTDLQLDLWNNLDGCQCPRCLGEALWPEWATPSSNWRPIKTIKVSGERL